MFGNSGDSLTGPQSPSLALPIQPLSIHPYTSLPVSGRQTVSLSLCSGSLSIAHKISCANSCLPSFTIQRSLTNSISVPILRGS